MGIAKELGWQEIAKRRHHAITSAGVYAIEDQGSHWGHDRFWLYVPNGVSSGKFDAIEDAKAAAQTDYERRIRASIPPSALAAIEDRQEMVKALESAFCFIEDRAEPSDDSECDLVCRLRALLTRIGEGT